MRKAKEKNKPLLSLAAAGLAALLLFGMATAVLAQGTQGKFVADEWSGIAEADIAEGDSTKDQAENQASTTPTPTPVSTQDESTALSDATPESAESSELTENKETDSDSNAEIPAEVSAFSNDLAVEEVSLYDASGTSAQDAVTSWTELKSAVASAANGATIYLSGEITIPLDEVLSVSKNLRLVGTGSAQYTNTVGVGSETVAQGYTYTQNASLRMGDASGVQTDHDNVMIYISGGTTLEIENVFLNGNNNCENVVYTEGTDSKISLQNCTVGYGNDNGILLNPGQAEINGSLVFNNGEYAGDGTALYRFENGSAVLSGNVRSQGLGGGGLTCAAGSHVQAAASSFVWNKTSGFDIPEADSSASAENCFFWGNGWTGANVRSNSVMTLTGCQVENNGYNTANLLTTDGDTASNTFPGLDVQGAGTMKISHCGILNNAGNGVQCYPDSKTYLYGWNHIYANGINGVYTQGQLWIGKAADSANGDETTAVYNNAADGVHTDGGTVQGDHLNCYGNSYSGISAMKNESLDQTATLELTAPVTSHENGHSGLYLKGGTKATVSGGSFTENGAEHAEIYAGSGTDTTLKDGVEVKTSADKTLQNSGLRIAVMLDGVDVFRTDSTLQIPAGDSIHLKQDADVVTWNGGTREQLGVTCENPWLGRTIIQSDTAVLDWENSRESNNAQTAEQHPENGIDTNVYYTAIEDAYFGMKNSDAHDVWLSYRIFKQAAGKTARSILVSVGVRLAAFNLPQIARLTMADELHLEELGERKIALFCCIPDSDKSLNYLVGMIYSQLIQTLYRQADRVHRGRLPVPVHLLIDEFPNISLPKDSFLSALATMRSRGIFCSIIAQNMAQLKAMYKNDWESLVGLCDEFLYLGGNEQGTHKYVSELIGKETISIASYNRSRGRNGSYSVNRQTSGRELLKPDEVRLLGDDKAILFVRGERPILDDKYDLLRHPNIRFTEDGGASPYDYTAAAGAANDLPGQPEQYELLDMDDFEDKPKVSAQQNLQTNLIYRNRR